MTKLKIIRHTDTGNVVSVYRGTSHLGMIYCPVVGGENACRVKADAPFCDRLPDTTFTIEQEAIDYLASVALWGREENEVKL